MLIINSCYVKYNEIFIFSLLFSFELMRVGSNELLQTIHPHSRQIVSRSRQNMTG
jgi:hypothetical protein